MGLSEKPLVWLHGEIKTPPFSKDARLEAGFFIEEAAARRKVIDAAVETDAVDWDSLSRGADKR
jgi:hypothetical protein